MDEKWISIKQILQKVCKLKESEQLTTHRKLNKKENWGKT